MSWLVNPDVVSRRLGDTVVLVNLADNAIYELNRTGARTMELITVGKTLEQIIEQLTTEFASDRATVAGEVERLVGELVAAGLIRRSA